MKKIQNMHYGFGSAKWFLALAQFQQGFVAACERQSNIVHMREKSVINMI
jgi:hypothetical protein